MKQRIKNGRLVLSFGFSKMKVISDLGKGTWEKCEGGNTILKIEDCVCVCVCDERPRMFKATGKGLQAGRVCTESKRASR